MTRASFEEDETDIVGAFLRRDLHDGRRPHAADFDFDRHVRALGVRVWRPGGSRGATLSQSRALSLPHRTIGVAVSLGGSFPPIAPPPDRDPRPDRLDDSERPCALEKTVERRQSARASESQNEPRATILQRVEDQHCRHGRKAKRCKSVHDRAIRQGAADATARH